jgi:hypothetical protein
MRSQMPTLAQYNNDYATAKALGSPMLASNAYLVPIGAEHLRLLFLSTTRPMVTLNDPADVSYAGGLQVPVAGTPKTKYMMSVTIQETDAGTVTDFGEFLVENGGNFDCYYYDGRPEAPLREYFLQGCCMTMEGGGEIGAENRSTVVTISAQLEYVYFGQNAGLGSVGNGSVLGAIQGIVSKAQSALNIGQQIKNLF